jgi:hypothetical protein
MRARNSRAATHDRWGAGKLQILGLQHVTGEEQEGYKF